MNPFKLGIRNAGRNPRRSFLTALAMTIAVMAVTFFDGYLRGASEGVIGDFVQLQSGKVKVIPEAGVGRTRPLPLDESITDLAKVLEIVEQDSSIITAAPRIKFPVLLEKKGGSIPSLGMAVLPSLETEILKLNEILVEGEIPDDTSNGALVGIDLAEELGLNIGDELFIVTTDVYGSLGPGLYTVSGLTRCGVKMIDKKTFYIPLPAAQEQLYMENSAAEIYCDISLPIEDAPVIAARLNEQLKQNGFKHLAAVSWLDEPMLAEMYDRLKFANLLMMLFLGVIAITAVVNTILMSVMERTREIGTLRAIGFHKSHIIKLILAESLVIGITSTIAGTLLGMLVSFILAKTGLDYSSALESVDIPMRPIIYPIPKWTTAIQTSIFGVLLSILAAWYPARVAVRKQPADAVRAE